MTINIDPVEMSSTQFNTSLELPGESRPGDINV